MKPEVELFKALSDETRIRIMKLLTGFNKPICVCEIVDSLTLPQYLISRHLNILRRAGLIEDSRDGTWVSYSIPNQPTALIYQLIEAIKQNLEGQVFEEDHHRLKLRLRLRQNGRCIIGYDNQKCLKLIRKLKKSNKRG
jgi:ArsR family transcriptional regulator